MAVIGQYKCEIQLTPGPATESYRIVVDAYHLGSVGSGSNIEQVWTHTYDFNVTPLTPESHILRHVDQDLGTPPIDPTDHIYMLPDIGANVIKVVLTPYDAADGAQGSGTAGDTRTLYLGTPASASIMRAQNAGGSNLVAPLMKGTGGITMTVANNVIEVDGAGAGGGYTTLASLTDTTISSPGVGDYLRHDGTDWKNAAITEADITDGTLLARLASNETITGAWSFDGGIALQDETGDPFAGTAGYQTIWANAGGVIRVRDGTNAPVTVVTGIANGTNGGLSVSGTGPTRTLALDITDLLLHGNGIPDGTGNMLSTDFFSIYSGDAGATVKIRPADIPVSLFYNDAGYTAGALTAAGAGLVAPSSTVSVDYTGSANSLIGAANDGTAVTILATDGFLFGDGGVLGDVKHAQLSQLSDVFVDLTSAQTIGGNKTFSNWVRVDGQFAINQAVTSQAQAVLGGTFTVGAGQLTGTALRIDTDVVGDSATTTRLSIFEIGGGRSITTNATITDVVSAHFIEPAITINTGTITYASTVKIDSAPDEGSTANYALWVASGNTRLSTLVLDTALTAPYVNFADGLRNEGSALQVDISSFSNAQPTLLGSDEILVYDVSGAAGADHFRVRFDEINLSFFINDLSISAEDVAPGTFNTTGGTYTFPDASVVRFGNNSSSTAKLQFGNLAVGGGFAYANVLSVPAEDALDIGAANWDIDIIGATVSANGTAVSVQGHTHAASEISAGTFGTGDFTFPQDLTITDQLRVTGVGPHGIGIAPGSSEQIRIGGTFANQQGLVLLSTLEPPASANGLGVWVKPTLQEAASGTHTHMVSLNVAPPTILAGAASVTNTAAVRITGAASAGVNNYALWVEAGQTRLSSLVLDTALGATEISLGNGIKSDGGAVAFDMVTGIALTDNVTPSVIDKTVDNLIYYDDSALTHYRIQFDDIPISSFNNDAGYTANALSVAGTGLDESPTGTVIVKYTAGSNLVDGASAGTAVAADLILFRADADGIVKKDSISNLLAISHNHAASDITSGTFGTGDYTFPDSLTVTDQITVSGVGVNAIGGATQSNIQLRLHGTMGSGVNRALKIESRIKPGLNTDGSLVRVGGTIDEFTSGTHALFMGAQFDPPVITAGAATVTTAATVYIAGQPSGGASNYALLVDSGGSRFDGIIEAIGDLDVHSGVTFVHETADLAGSAGAGTMYVFDNLSSRELRLRDGTGTISNIPIIPGAAANDELLVSTGADHEAEWSGSGLTWNGTTLNATAFSGNGSALTGVQADSSTVGNLTTEAATYYPMMADGASGAVSHFVNSTDLRWKNTASINQLLVADGTAVDPIIGFIADEDTGIFSPGVGAIAFTAAGSERMRVDFDKVGIEETTPKTRLHIGAKVVDDNSYVYDADSLMVVHQTPTSNTTLNDPQEVLLLARQGTATQAYGAAASFRLSRYENSSTHARTRLDLVLADTTFLNGSRTVLTARSDGNVGIGTTAPSCALDVEISSGQAVQITGNTAGAYISFIRSAGAATGYIGSANHLVTGGVVTDLGIRSEGNIVFRANSGGGAHMILDTNGHVGIGTSTPNSVLHVVSGDDNDLVRIRRFSATGRSQFRLDDEVDAEMWRFGMTGGGVTDFNFFDGTQNALVLKRNGDAYFTPGGKVGIGTTSPDSALDVYHATENNVAEFHSGDPNASIRLKDLTQTGYWGLQSDQMMTFGATATVNVNNLNLDTTNGNVGIGTTSPNYKLVVDQTTGDNSIAQFKSSDVVAQAIFTDSGGSSFFGTNNGIAWMGNSGGTPASGLAINGTNVGIGTTSPAGKLDVKTAASGNDIVFRHTGATNNPGFFLETNESGNYVLIAQSSQSGNGTLRLGVDNEENIRFYRDGGTKIRQPGTLANAAGHAALLIENAVGQADSWFLFNGSGENYITSDTSGTAGSSARTIFRHYTAPSSYTNDMTVNQFLIDCSSAVWVTNKNNDLQFQANSSGATGNPYMEFSQAATNRAYIQYVNSTGFRFSNRDTARRWEFYDASATGTRVTYPNVVAIDESGPTVTINTDNNEAIKINHTSATGDPYISFHQAGSRRAFIQYRDSDDTLQLTTDVAPSSIEFAADNVVRFEITSQGASAGRAKFTTTQVYNVEGAEITTSGNVSLDWDAYNQVDITNDGTARIVTIDDNSMQDGGHYCLVIRYTSGTITSWTWSASGTLQWQGGVAPTLPNNTAGDRTVVTFVKTGGITLGFYADAYA